MKRDVAVELWTNALDSGTQFSTYVGDDDSTTIADILINVPYNVEKWSDNTYQTFSHHSSSVSIWKIASKIKTVQH